MVIDGPAASAPLGRGRSPFRKCRAALSTVLAGLVLAGCSSGIHTVAPESVIQGLHVSQIIAAMKHVESTEVTLYDYLPGTSIAMRGAPWPYYKGTFDFHAGTGSLRLVDPDSGPSVSWTLNSGGSILTTPVSQPFAAATTSPATSAITSGSPPVAGGANGGPFNKNEEVLFSRIVPAGYLDPVETYEAVVVNPAFWIGLLGSSSNPLGKGVPSLINGGHIYRYDVIFNLRDVPSTSSHAQRAAMKWLAGYFGTRYLAGEIWLDRTGKLVRIRFIRLSRFSAPPRNTLQFPDPAFHLSLTLTLLASTGTRTHPSTNESISILGRADGPKPRCVPAGQSGLSARVVARVGQHITGKVDAYGCDVGVYVGSGTSGVVVSGATITGANVHGIMVVDTSGTTIERSTVDDSTIGPNAIESILLSQAKAIELVGTTDARIIDNNGVVSIGIVDNGAITGAAINPGIPSPATRNLVEGNHISGSILVTECSIVLAAYNPGEGVIDNTISDNTMPGSIIVASDTADTLASRNVVEDNTVVNSLLNGIELRSSGAGDTVQSNEVIGNTLSHDAGNTICGLSRSTGIAMFGAAGAIVGTEVRGNIITNEEVGVWSANAHGTVIAGNSISVPPGGSPVIQLHLALPNGCRS